MVRHSMRMGVLSMRINKKYDNFMLHRCKTYYELDDYKIIIFKFGKRKFAMFYVPLYEG